MFTIAHRFPATIFLLLGLNFILTAQTADQDRTAKQKAVDASLYTACIDGDMPGVQRALRDGADVNAYNSNGRTPLIAAALSLHYPVIDVLLKAGARAEMQNDAGETAARLLGLAKTPPDVGESEGTALMRFMAEKKAYEKKLNDAAAPGTELARQLVSAVAKGDIPTAKQLIAKGAYVDFKDARSSLVPTVLIVATEKGFADVVEELINKGVRIDRADAQGRTALYYAVGKQNIELVRLLAGKGNADTGREVGGQTIMQFARSKPNQEITSALITAEFMAGAREIKFDLDFDPEIISAGILYPKRSEKDTKLLEAVAGGRRPGQGEAEYGQVLSGLLASGSSPDTRDDRGRTLLMIAAETQNSMALMTLLKSKAAIDEQDVKGMTALMHAVLTDNIAIVSALLKAGAKTGIKNNAKRTAYDIAAEKKGSVFATSGYRLKPQ